MRNTRRMISVIGAILFPLACLGQQETATIDIFTMTSIPKGQYEVNLQLQGKDRKLTMQVDDQTIKTIRTNHPPLEGLEGTYELIGNGAFLVRLRNPQVTASQFWLFRPDGSAVIKEIPDRGEQQKAVPVRPGKEQR